MKIRDIYRKEISNVNKGGNYLQLYDKGKLLNIGKDLKCQGKKWRINNKNVHRAQRGNLYRNVHIWKDVLPHSYLNQQL